MPNKKKPQVPKNPTQQSQKQPTVPREIKIVTNRPTPDKMLQPSFIFQKLMSGIIADHKLLKHFPNSEKQHSTLKELVKKAKCTGCKLNQKGKPLLKAFLQELKNSPKEIQDNVTSRLGKKTIVSMDNKWIDVKENTITPFDFRTVPLQQLRGGGKLDPKQPINFPSPTALPVALAAAPPANPDVKKVLFKNHQGPGDIVMLTAAIRDLHASHPNEFITDVQTTSMSIWEGNPYVGCWKGQGLDENDPSVKTYQLGYPLIHQSNQGPFHFSEAFTEEIEDQLGIRIKKRLGKGDIHIRPEEEVWGYTERATWFKDYGIDPNAEFWVVDAGHKQDFTAKFWGSGKFQAVVKHFKGKIQFVQVGHSAHIHPELKGVVNLIGKTDDRQLIRLIWASSGVLSPVSYPMVLAAAIPVKAGTCKGRLERPCVVVAGGREPAGWQAHTNHQFIHTCGCMPCCDRGGCWTSRTKPIGDGDEKDSRNLCHNVTIDDYGEEVPYCMHVITIDDVIRRIEMYEMLYKDDRKKYSYNKDENKQ